MSWQARLIAAGLRLLVRPRLARERNPRRARARFLLAARLFFRDPPFAIYLPDRLRIAEHSVPALWARVAGTHERGVLLYLHGGAYMLGSPRTHRAMAARLASESGLAAILPRYRLAPETAFPAAFDDALTAYRALLARGYPPARIALAGDSAGGGLALALMAEIGRLGLPRPAALLAFSPLVDMTFSHRSMRENARRDALLPVQRARDMRAFYMPQGDPFDPRASPLFAEWTPPVPPSFILASRAEILRDDAVAMAERLRAAGGRAECELWDAMIHVWPIFQGYMPEADAALARAGRFLRRQIPDA